MENLTHTLVGVALGKAGLQEWTPAALPILIVAANLPDVEMLSGLVGLNRLDYHRGITHAVGGIVLFSALLSGAIWLASRWRQRDPEKRLRFGRIWAVCLLGMASHPLLDFLVDYGVQPWLPFSTRKYYGDLLSMADPWLWIILGSALYLSTVSNARKARFFYFTLLVAMVIALAVWGAGWRMMLIWLIVLGVALAAGGVLKRRDFNLTRIALCACVVYIAGVAAVRSSVWKSAAEVGVTLVPEPVKKIDVLPRRPLMRWTVVMESADRFYLADVDLQDWRRRPPKFEAFAKNLNDPCFKRALENAEMATMIRFARFPAVQVREFPEGCVVTLRDLRYARHSAAGFGVASVTLPPATAR